MNKLRQLRKVIRKYKVQKSYFNWMNFSLFFMISYNKKSYMLFEEKNYFGGYRVAFLSNITWQRSYSFLKISKLQNIVVTALVLFYKMTHALKNILLLNFSNKYLNFTFNRNITIVDLRSVIFPYRPLDRSRQQLWRSINKFK